MLNSYRVVTVRVCSLAFGLHGDQCAESLSITKKDVPGLRLKWFELCNNDTKINPEYPDSLNTIWHLTYSKLSGHPGGRFWIAIEGILTTEVD